MRIRLRTIVLRHLLHLSIAIAGFTGSAHAQQSAPKPKDPLAAAEQRWAAHGPTDYSFLHKMTCVCPASGATSRVIVRGGRVVADSAADPESAKIRARSTPDSLPTIKSLFWMAHYLTHGRFTNVPVTVKVTYDPQLGYPSHMMSHDSGRTDNDIEITVWNLKPLK